MVEQCNSKYLIETRSVSRRFGDKLAVDRVNLLVPAGSVYGFLGPNGAGKTTTIRMLLGLIRPTGGQICVFARPLNGHKLDVLSKIGALVEAPSLYPHLTGRENLEVTRRLVGSAPRSVSQALSVVKLTGDANRLVRTYSQGMRQRLSLALALLNDPALLILDEPTNGLDPAGILEMRELIRKLPVEFGVTVFLSSHLLKEVEQIASHIGIINQGRLLFQGRIQDLQAQRKPRLNLAVERPDDVQAFLVAEGWPTRSNGNGHLYVEINDESDSTRINTNLIKAGWQVQQITVERPNLEETFLALTGEPNHT
jgi:ABC-type multidrug transport system ATPase subunit